jgi:hypothetical protein
MRALRVRGPAALVSFRLADSQSPRYGQLVSYLSQRSTLNKPPTAVLRLMYELTSGSVVAYGRGLKARATDLHALIARRIDGHPAGNSFRPGQRLDGEVKAVPVPGLIQAHEKQDGILVIKAQNHAILRHVNNGVAPAGREQDVIDILAVLIHRFSHHEQQGRTPGRVFGQQGHKRVDE